MQTPVRALGVVGAPLVWFAVSIITFVLGSIEMSDGRVVFISVVSVLLLPMAVAAFKVLKLPEWKPIKHRDFFYVMSCIVACVALIASCVVLGEVVSAGQAITKAVAMLSTLRAIVIPTFIIIILRPSGWLRWATCITSAVILTFLARYTNVWTAWANRV